MLSSELIFASSLVHETFILTLLRHLYVKLERAVKLIIFQLALMAWCLYKKDKQANTTVYKPRDINVLKKHIRCFGGSLISAEDDQNYDIRIFPTLVQATTVALPSMAYGRAGFFPNQNLFPQYRVRVCKLSPHLVYLF